MSSYIELPVSNVLKEGVTTKPELCDKKYVVYINKSDSRQKVRVNTDYLLYDDYIKLNMYYDRGLCDTIEQYHELDLPYIESQAYGAWMDGAR